MPDDRNMRERLENRLRSEVHRRWGHVLLGGADWLAEAALDELHEPTEAMMIAAGCIDLQCRRDCNLGSHRAKQAWQAMLTAAKQERG